jgi:hypothetical protein
MTEEAESRQTYSVEELQAVAEMLGAGSFPGAGGAFDGLSEEARAACLRTARRSLVARNVVEIDADGVLSVVPPHAALFRIALAPAAALNAERHKRDSLETRAYYVLPEGAVEHAPAVGLVHRLDRFDTEQLVERLRAFLAFEERPGDHGSEFELPLKSLNAALAAVAHGNGESPALPDAPDHFSQALNTFDSTSYVRSLHRAGNSLVGGELRWIDTQDSGLWLVEPSSDDPECVAVRPTRSSELLEELLSYLPGADRQPAAT